MEVLYERCAGLDGHKKTVVACLRRSAPGGVTVQQTRTFSTMVLALEALRDWLLGEGCTAVGMEATGVYGKPVYNVLEGHGFELVVANAEHIKAVPGRKTDPTHAEVVGLRYTYRPVFVTIAGSHAYGFPSANSDLDLRGMHVTPIEDVLGIFSHDETVEWKQTRHVAVAFDEYAHTRFARPGDEVIGSTNILIETVTHDVATYALLLLKLNGNALEQLHSPYVITITERGEELRDDVVPPLLAKAAANHYLGFAQHEWKEVLSRPTAKKILYVFRVILTGISLMVTGRVDADIHRTSGPFRHALPFLNDLLAVKTGGVETSGSDGVVELKGALEAARDASHLPDAPSQRAKARRKQWVRGFHSALLPGRDTRRDIPAGPEELP